jgi:2-polyprenyl-3-methyl-5-hydroxy-6-metoxy-1,4-benzoquinol methylase
VVDHCASSPDESTATGQYHDYESVSACDLCGSLSFRIADATADIVQCESCTFRFVTPRPTQNEIARAYSAPDQYDSWIAFDAARQALWERRWSRVRRRKPAGRLLDIGAGLGTFAALAKQDGWSVDGTEVSETAVRYAVDRYDIALRLGQLEAMELKGGSYDLITLWHVLEHVPSPASTLARCHELLAPNGLLIMAMPNDGAAAHSLSAVGGLFRRLRGRRSLPRYVRLHPCAESHLSHFTPGTLRRRLATSRFSVEALSVDDAAPVRSSAGAALFRIRTSMTALTPWNFGLEMFVVSRRLG